MAQCCIRESYPSLLPGNFEKRSVRSKQLFSKLGSPTIKIYESYTFTTAFSSTDISFTSSSNPKLPAIATIALVSNGVALFVISFGLLDTCAPTVHRG